MDSKITAQVEAYVDEVWEDVVADIAALVAHPSVADASQGIPGAPFGAPVRGALDCALGIAEKLGYEVGDDEGYVGIADIPGAEDRQIATIAHVDVVPAGPGWNTDPFTCTRREGWLLGRGVIDDKGPAVLSLYAGAFLKQLGTVPRYTFRALIGCDEEVGMTDIHHYLSGHDDPDFLFTPDAEFPVGNAEKGQYGATFTSAPVTDGVILSWSGAEATNAIPAESVCELAVDASACPAPAANADRLAIETVAPGRTRITARGIGGHASLPEGTVNAIALIVDYLRGADLASASERPFLELMARIHEDTAGASMGIASSNEAFGPLTVIGGTVEVSDGRIRQTVDVRYPDSTTDGRIAESCRALAAEFGATCTTDHAKEPFSVSADHPAVQTLLDVYREVTGRPAEPFSMGGGTYARNFARAVSFGPEDNDLELPAWGGSMHGPNECASEAQLKEAFKIYILATLRLMEVDL